MFKGFYTAPALAVLLTLAAPQVFAEEQRLLSVSGEATVQRAPDQGMVRFGVEARAKTAQAAMETVAGNMTAILVALEAKGVAAKDMQSSGLSLYPIYPDRNSDGPIEPEGFGAYSTAKNTDKLNGDRKRQQFFSRPIYSPSKWC